MPETSLLIDYAAIRREVGRFLGYGRDPASPAWTTPQVTDVDDCIRAGLRMFYYPPPIGKDSFGHRWSFLFEEALLTTNAPYSTGTITVAPNGSGSIVTLSGVAAWPSWAASGELIVAGSSYTVLSRTSDTVIRLVDTAVTVAAGTSYMIGQYIYDLPSNYGAIMGPFIYEPRNTWPNIVIEVTSVTNMAVRRSPTIYTMRPDMAAIRPKAYDPTAGQTYQVMFAPTPNASYTLRYRYEINPNMIDATNLYARGGAPHSETILAACLAAAESKLNDQAGLKKQEFMERLVTSVLFDRQAHSPDTLGYDKGCLVEVTPGDKHGILPNQLLYNGAAL